jgi:hypothetical protein
LQLRGAEVKTMLRAQIAMVAFAAMAIACPSRDAEVDQTPVTRAPETPRPTEEREMTGSMDRMHGMMSECMQHCEKTMSAVDETTRALDEAKQSNDPAKISAALDQARAQMQSIKQHTTSCMDMMEGHQGMMGRRPEVATPPERPEGG